MRAVGEEARGQLFAEHGVAEHVDEVRIEDRLLVLRERDARLLRRERLAKRVAGVARQVRVRVADGEQARAQRDVLAADPIGEPLAVVALVHPRGDLDRVSAGRRTGSSRRDGSSARLLRGGLVPVVLAAVERREVVLAHLAEVVDEGRDHEHRRARAASRPSFSPSRRTRRATCAECPRRSARMLSSRLTSTWRSSTNDASLTFWPRARSAAATIAGSFSAGAGAVGTGARETVGSGGGSRSGSTRGAGGGGAGGPSSNAMS